jgi:Uma2 family endonuclease
MSATTDGLISRHRLSVGDFQRMAEAGIFQEDDRVELIEGEIVDMTPIGSGHAGAVKRLSNLIKLAVGERAIVSTQDPIMLGEDSEPQPDLALLRPRDDFYADSHPGPEDILLIVEVADASLRYDTEVKLPLYARHGIPEAWLVDLVNKRLLIHRSPSPQGYGETRVATTLDAMCPLHAPDAPVDLRGLF